VLSLTYLSSATDLLDEQGLTDLMTTTRAATRRTG
jgi:hypothetical protein